MIIPEGYRLAVVTPDGSIADMIDIADYDLTSTFAAHEVAAEVDRIISTREALR